MSLILNYLQLYVSLKYRYIDSMIWNNIIEVAVRKRCDNDDVESDMHVVSVAIPGHG